MRSRLLAVLVLWLSVTCTATTVVPMSVERLTRASSHVVLARAVRSWSAWDSSHSLIFTYTRFALVRRLKGPHTSSFVVKQMGGSAGGYSQHVAGVHGFVAGQEALLFLHPSASGDGTLVVTGLMQGNFRVFRSSGGEAMVSNGVAGVRSFDRRTARIATYGGTRLKLRDLESQVAAVAP